MTILAFLDFHLLNFNKLSFVKDSNLENDSDKFDKTLCRLRMKMLCQIFTLMLYLGNGTAITLVANQNFIANA